MSHEQLFRDNLKLIDEVIDRICRRHGASDDEREEFRSLAHIKLMDDDYRVLRDYRGESSLRTYLAFVLNRAFLDYRIHKWGKWRASAVAEMLGEVAMRLEQLVYRDHYSFDQAVLVLQINHHVEETRDELWAIFERLPSRLDRRPQTEEALDTLTDPAPLPDTALMNAEEDSRRQQEYETLQHALDRLKPPDRLIIKMMFEDDMKQVDIARALHEGPKPFYRRCARILKELKRLLKDAGIDPWKK